ncbi:MAG: hypothetical protein ACM359_17540 [Bacillota bacterium]
MLDTSLISSFDRIYSTDLVYEHDCWQLCGNGHCCNYTRYKSQFTMLGHQHYQELPLLPGEHDYWAHKGWLNRFGEFEHRVIPYPLSSGTMQIEFLVGRSKSCACEHATRTTICRLYPLLPVYDVPGNLIGVDTGFGIFEEIEDLDHLPRACRIASIPFAELGKFLAIALEIGHNPKAVFYTMAYRLAKLHARRRLEQLRGGRSVSALAVLERAFLIRQLLDQSVLRPELDALAGRFREHYGSRFVLD